MDRDKFQDVELSILRLTVDTLKSEMREIVAAATELWGAYDEWNEGGSGSMAMAEAMDACAHAVITAVDEALKEAGDE